MDALESKKLALLFILEILKKHSDPDHSLTHQEIADRLEQDYGVVIERKAIARNLALLRSAGYDIEIGRKGSYLGEREFTEEELRMLIDGVLSSRHISANYSNALIGKLCNLTGKFFRTHLKHIHSVKDWSKTENQQVFYNISIVDEAIENKKQIRFTYNRYGADKKLHPTAAHSVSPYQFILKNQRYYLMGLNEHWKTVNFYRVDRITEMEITDLPRTPLEQVKGYERGIDYRAFSSALPYMFGDTLARVVFYADELVIDQVLDWFGNEAEIRTEGDRLRVTVRVSPAAMEFWAMQYLNYVEIKEPESLRQKIAGNLKAAMEKYQ